MIRTLGLVFVRARDVLQTEGLISLLRRGFIWLAGCIFENVNLYLYEYPIQEGNMFDFMPRSQHFSCHIVFSNQEADELAANSCALQKYVINARERLAKGAIAFCILAGQELASMHWVALTQEAMNTFDPYPYQVDFLNAEVCMGGVLTIPKYRGKGLIAYGACESFQFLRERGITTMRHSANTNNTIARSVYAKFDSKIYAKARYLKVLWWKFWRETPLIPTSYHD